jgi:hypothetical protein
MKEGLNLTMRRRVAGHGNLVLSGLSLIAGLIASRWSPAA